MNGRPTSSAGPLVMHVVHSIEPGGTERTLCRLVRALHDDGARHMVCTLRTAGPFASALGDDIELLELRARRRDPLLFVRLAREIKRRRVDIIHARNWGTWTDTMLAARLARRANLLLGFHGLQANRAFSAAQQRRARLLRLNCCRAATLSPYLRDILIQQLGFCADRIHILPNGVDLNRFTPPSQERRIALRSRIGLSPGDIVFGNIGNFFDPVKGHAVLVDAFATVAARVPHAHLILAGYGPMEPTLRAQVNAAGLTDRIHFVGWVEQVENVLAALDIFVLPSLSEGMSNALLEAMATGLPCVVTDVADHRALFNAVDPHAIVPPSDAPRLAAALLRLADAVPPRTVLGDRLHRLATERFSFTRTLQAYRDLYARLADNHRWPAPAPETAAQPPLCADVR